MNLIEAIKDIDTSLLLSINGCHSAYFDQFMFTFSSKFVWLPFYVSVLAYLLIKNKKDALPAIVALIVCIVLCDQISSSIIKDSVERLRPTRTSLLPQLHIVNDYLGGKYGFVSSHAANTFGFAVLTSYLFKQNIYTAVVFLWAVITSYSRVYLGVHYPLDVVGGAMVGIAVGYALLWALKKYFPKVLTESSQNDTKKSIQHLPVSVLSVSIFALLIYSFI